MLPRWILVRHHNTPQSAHIESWSAYKVVGLIGIFNSVAVRCIESGFRSNQGAIARQGLTPSLRAKSVCLICANLVLVVVHFIWWFYGMVLVYLEARKDCDSSLLVVGIFYLVAYFSFLVCVFVLMWMVLSIEGCPRMEWQHYSPLSVENPPLAEHSSCPD